MANVYKVVNETMGIKDGDAGDRFDPDGSLVETAPALDGASATVWTKKYPPFVYRPVWTEDS